MDFRALRNGGFEKLLPPNCLRDSPRSGLLANLHTIPHMGLWLAAERRGSRSPFIRLLPEGRSGQYQRLVIISGLLSLVQLRSAGGVREVIVAVERPMEGLDQGLAVYRPAEPVVAIGDLAGLKRGRHKLPHPDDLT